MLNRIAFSAVFLMLIFSANAYAGKSSVEIIAPETAKIGSTVTVKVTVSHVGNNFIHHTSWAYVKVNGKEVGRWEYPSLKNDVKDDSFSREVTFLVTGPTELEAMANCNLHGSAGAKNVTLKTN